MVPDEALSLLYPLEGWLVRRYPAVDPHLRSQAAEEAVLESLRHPERRYPTRAALMRRQQRYARYTLLHALRHEGQEAALAATLGEHMPRTGPDVLRVVCAREALREVWWVPEALLAQSSVAELWLLELLLLRVRGTDPAAHVLGVAMWPWPARKAAVRAAKSRLRKRYLRAVRS
jgi:hypothetical protein